MLGIGGRLAAGHRLRKARLVSCAARVAKSLLALALAVAVAVAALA